MPVFILEARSLHILLCPIYTSLDHRALSCQLAEKNPTEKMAYFHTQNMQIQLKSHLILTSLSKLTLSKLTHVYFLIELGKKLFKWHILANFVACVEIQMSPNNQK